MKKVSKPAASTKAKSAAHKKPPAKPVAKQASKKAAPAKAAKLPHKQERPVAIPEEVKNFKKKLHSKPEPDELPKPMVKPKPVVAQQEKVAVTKTQTPAERDRSMDESMKHANTLTQVLEDRRHLLRGESKQKQPVVETQQSEVKQEPTTLDEICKKAADMAAEVRAESLFRGSAFEREMRSKDL